MDERDRHVFIARIALTAERYDEMVEAMNAVAKFDVELTEDEYNLLSVGYKNVITARRVALSTLFRMRQRELDAGDEQKVQMINDFMKKLEDEITTKCDELLSLIDQHLLASSKTQESKIFLHKMRGDYFRYLAEVKEGDDHMKDASQATIAYEDATTLLAMSALPAYHPLRLGLALNYSVFHKDIMNSGERAYEIAKVAYDNAVTELDKKREEYHPDSAALMNLINDNLTLWSGIADNEGEHETGEPSNVQNLFEKLGLW